MAATATPHEHSDAASISVNKFVDGAVAGNNRALSFFSRDLGQDIDLLLMFEPPAAGRLYVDLFPVCWKVLSLSAGGLSTASVEYTAASGFFVPQVESGNRVFASNSQPCETGQRCTLRINDNGNGNSITAPVPGVGGSMQCLNTTGRPASIGMGFFNTTGTKMEPALLWDNVANNSILSIQLTPRLKIYAVRDYKATELIRGDIESPLLFERNLIALPASTTWKVFIDEGTGEIKIEASN
ncbi:hypothetical protein JR316_0012708 [Psilocybe cubensis]|uniref:Uncharacterized protein n=2 Tax=Psilocybe cubensis TaxID=181762 RepID=A0ACB8GJ93_PSICU|nr:hypothetical protein JR316_0012708 [Psilocybe cubensis]KAH9475591.1 hypothetical protein JR316_0012708 [Psilocybe cubensis]